MIYEAHTLNEEIGQAFDIENILSTTLKGDKLAKFLQDWDTVLAGQIAPASELILKPLLHRQLMSSPSLKAEMVTTSVLSLTRRTRPTPTYTKF